MAAVSPLDTPASDDATHSARHTSATAAPNILYSALCCPGRKACVKPAKKSSTALQSSGASQRMKPARQSSGSGQPARCAYSVFFDSSHVFFLWFTHPIHVPSVMPATMSSGSVRKTR